MFECVPGAASPIRAALPCSESVLFLFQIFRGGTAGWGPAQQDHAEQMEAGLINSTPASPERKHLRVLLI